MSGEVATRVVIATPIEAAPATRGFLFSVARALVAQHGDEAQAKRVRDDAYRAAWTDVDKMMRAEVDAANARADVASRELSQFRHVIGSHDPADAMARIRAAQSLAALAGRISSHVALMAKAAAEIGALVDEAEKP